VATQLRADLTIATELLLLEVPTDDRSALVAHLRDRFPRALVHPAGPVSVDDARLMLDPVRHSASHAGRSVDLSRREFQLMERLLRAAPHAVTRADLLDAIWCGRTSHAVHPSNVLEVYVSYLRRKLKTLGCGDALRTVRGVGYALDRP